MQYTLPFANFRPSGHFPQIMRPSIRVFVFPAAAGLPVDPVGWLRCHRFFVLDLPAPDLAPVDPDEFLPVRIRGHHHRLRVHDHFPVNAPGDHPDLVPAEPAPPDLFLQVLFLRLIGLLTYPCFHFRMIMMFSMITGAGWSV
jgi:hypothetical protein